MRLRSFARLGTAAVVAVLVGGACGGGDGAASTDPTVVDPPVPHVPDDIAAGCGTQAVTNPADLDAGRVVARCGPEAPEAQPLPAPATVRVAVPPSQGLELAPLLVADALGEFEAENLQVEVEPMPFRDALAGVEAGDVDLVVGPVDGPYFDALYRGSRARLVLGGTLSRAPNAMTVDQTGLWVRTDALDDDGLSDLQLQPVGVPGGMRSAATYPIGQVLGQTEITLNEVALADTSAGDAVQQLIDGDLAAAWLDGGSWYQVADREGFELYATLPASEAVDGTIAAPRLLGPDRAVGLAYTRAIVRTINTYLTGDYRREDDVVDALAGALDVDGEVLRALPPVLFDWEVREGTLGRIEDALLALGGVTYDRPLDSTLLVDRTLATEAVGGDDLPVAG
jgi:NitT/TauT family transport system substrate-binding protein